MLTSNAGSVTINSGSANRIIVQAKKYANFGGNHLNATTDVGSINTSFPVTVNRSTTGATANGDEVPHPRRR